MPNPRFRRKGENAICAMRGRATGRLCVVIRGVVSDAVPCLFNGVICDLPFNVVGLPKKMSGMVAHHSMICQSPARCFGFRPPRWRRACWGRCRQSRSKRTACGRGAPMAVAASANVASRMEARFVIRSAVFISDLLATSCRITRCSGERPQGRASFHARVSLEDRLVFKATPA